MKRLYARLVLWLIRPALGGAIRTKVATGLPVYEVPRRQV